MDESNALLTLHDLTRKTLAGMLQQGVEGVDLLHDINKSCGYPDVITAENYQYLYDREGLATRCVSLYPSESWVTPPNVYETEDEKETEFEKAWKEIERKLHLYDVFEQVDEISGIGRYGILFLGLNDGKEPDKPVEKKEGMQINYLRAFSEAQAKVDKFETNKKDPRYGKPVMYKVKMEIRDSGDMVAPALQEVKVHHTRVLHIADNQKGDPVFGIPRLKKIYNRLVDMRKILGGSPEMFWKGGFPGLAVKVDPDFIKEGKIDPKKLRAEIEKYQEGLERYMATVGVSVESIKPQVADPSPAAMLQLKVIGISLGCPWRIFAGSEEAKLASEQDKNNWEAKIEKRRENYCLPRIVQPFIEMLMDLGVLPEIDMEKLTINFPPLSKRTEKEKAEYASNITKAIQMYISGNVDELLPEEIFLSHILGLEDELVKAIMKELDERAKDEEIEETPEERNVTPIDDGETTEERPDSDN